MTDIADYIKDYRLRRSAAARNLRLGDGVVPKVDAETALRENSGINLERAVSGVMGEEVKDSKFKLHLRGLDEPVRFSTDRYNDHASNILVLGVYSKKRFGFFSRARNVAALRYQVVESEGNNYGMSWDSYPQFNRDSENMIGICYVQTMTGVDIDEYQKLAEILGSRPHEFLVARFLSRIAPILNVRPQTKVVLNCDGPNSRKAIRDRFFDKKGHLNPDKDRVIQILGSDNNWLSLKAQEERTKHMKKA